MTRIRIKTARLPAFAIWTDRVNGEWAFLWPTSNVERKKSYEVAVRAAKARVRASTSVREVGVYQLVATISPDRTPVLTVTKKSHA